MSLKTEHKTVLILRKYPYKVKYCKLLIHNTKTNLAMTHHKYYQILPHPKGIKLTKKSAVLNSFCHGNLQVS